MEGTDTPAIDALFFKLVSLSGKWKLPIAYVLQNKTTAVAQVELVKSILTYTHKAGLTVWVLHAMVLTQTLL